MMESGNKEMKLLRDVKCSCFSAFEARFTIATQHKYKLIFHSSVLGNGNQRSITLTLQNASFNCELYLTWCKTYMLEGQLQ